MAELELTVVLPCLNEAETLVTVHREGAEEPGVARHRRRGRRRRQRQHRRLAGASRGRRGPGRRRPGARLRRGPAGRHRGRAGPLHHHGRRRRQLRLRRPRALRRGAARRATTSSWATASRGGIAPGAMPWLHRYLGNPVLSCLGRLFFRIPVARLPLRDARLPPRRHPRARPADHRHGVRQRDGRQARRCRACASARCRPRCARTAASRPPHLRTWRDGWRHLRFLLLSARAGCFSIPVAGAPRPGHPGHGRAVRRARPDRQADLRRPDHGRGSHRRGRRRPGPRSGARGPSLRGRAAPDAAERTAGAHARPLRDGERPRRRGPALAPGVRVLRRSRQALGGCRLRPASHADIRTPLSGLVLAVTGAQLILVSFMLSLARMARR